MEIDYFHGSCRGNINQNQTEERVHETSMQVGERERDFSYGLHISASDLKSRLSHTHRFRPLITFITLHLRFGFLSTACFSSVAGFTSAAWFITAAVSFIAASMKGVDELEVWRDDTSAQCARSDEPGGSWEQFDQLEAQGRKNLRSRSRKVRRE